MPPPVPSPDLIARFSADLAALAGDRPRVALAVSGGPDSLALLLLAAGALPGRVAAATVDHGLRPEARAEAAFVAELCAALDVPHRTLVADVDRARSSLQRAAREARYRALDGWLAETGTAWLATAHQMDDQAETVMMRLLRGSGVGGLGAIRPCAPLPLPGSRVTLIRPLLGWRRAELRAIVAGTGIVPVEDPSNADPRYDRARMRQRLAEAGWIDPVPLAASAAALAEADAALAWSAYRLWDERVRPVGAGFVLDPAGVPPELRRRLVLRLLRALGDSADEPRGPALGALLGRLESGATATLAGVRCVGGPRWRFERAPPRRPPPASS